MQTQDTISLNGRNVEYRIVLSKSASKLRVRVGPGGVAVTLPAGRDNSEAALFLRTNTAWLTDQLARVDALQSVRRPQIVSEGEILYQGEPVRVRVEESSAYHGAARIHREDCEVIIRRSALSAVPATKSLENWLRKEARAAIQPHIEDLTRRLDRTPNAVYLMGQRTKWGNCSARGNLSFNWRLIMAPDYALRYLVTHEVAHLAVPDHSKRFWLTVHSLCPEAERARQWLCKNGNDLFKTPLLT